MLRRDWTIYNRAFHLVLISLWKPYPVLLYICWAKPTHGSSLLHPPKLASGYLLHHTWVSCTVPGSECELLLHMSFKVGSKMNSLKNNKPEVQMWLWTWTFSLLFKRAIIHAATGRGEPKSRLVYQHHPLSGQREMSVDLRMTLASGGPQTQLTHADPCVFII